MSALNSAVGQTNMLPPARLKKAGRRYTAAPAQARRRDDLLPVPLARRAAIPRWKRCLDLGLVLLSLPIFLPVAVLIGLGVALVSPKGPIFFAQERIGYRGRRFKCWKFRSMKVSGGDADEAHRLHTTELIRNGKPWDKLDDRDPRVIPLGRLLRASGLDELPQLYNVLKGDMSVVGPRPAMPYEIEAYEPWQMERLECLPGLTGLWQVSGKNRTTFIEMLQLDIQYARRPSFAQDMTILAMTGPVLMKQVLSIFRRNRKQQPRS